MTKQIQQMTHELPTENIPHLTQHLRDDRGRPVVTLVAIGSNVDQIGVAYCGPNDSPCKAFGRNLALIRVIQGKPWYNVNMPYRYEGVVDAVHDLMVRANKYFNK